MAATAAAAPVLRPVPDATPAPDLEVLIPASFGEWRIDPDEPQVAPAPDVQANLARLYRQIVSRTYVNARGERMMLTVAHGGDQSDALKAHRQEACYSAQGFTIHGLERGALATAGRSIPVTRMHAVRGERSEPVTYWFTMGDRVVLGRAERLRVQLENGLAGRVPDGMLVRVSNLSGDVGGSYAAHESFVAAIIAAVPTRDAARLVGAARG
jgi:EpsI family protein